MHQEAPNRKPVPPNWREREEQMLAPYAKFREQMEGQIPSRRFADPNEIAGVVAYLLSPSASYITGAVLPVDGGLSAALGIHR